MRLRAPRSRPDRRLPRGDAERAAGGRLPGRRRRPAGGRPAGGRPPRRGGRRLVRRGARRRHRRCRHRRGHGRAPAADPGGGGAAACRCSARSRWPAPSRPTAEVLRRVAGGGVPVQIGYPRRFDAGFAAARAAVASGELGWLHTVRSTTLDPAPPPDAYLAASGGIFRDCAVHDYDAVRWVTGREVVEVYATGGNRGAEIFRRGRGRGHRGLLADARRRHPRGGVEHPLQRARPRRAAGAARLGGQHRGRARRPAAAAVGRARARPSRPGRRTRSSWTASRMRSGPSSPPSSRWPPAAGPRPARWRTRWRRRWSPRPATARRTERRPVRVDEVRPEHLPVSGTASSTARDRTGAQ